MITDLITFRHNVNGLTKGLKFMKNELIHEKKEYSDIRDLIEKASEMYADRVAFSYRKSPYDEKNVEKTFAELRDDVRALTTKFIDMGFKDKHVVIVGKLSYSWVLIYYSVLASGGVLVPLDREWNASDLAVTAISADADYAFFDEDVASKGESIKNEERLLGFFTTNLEGDLGKLKDEGAELFNTDSGLYFNNEIDNQKLSLLVFTSGTTGKGKGVMLSQRAILSDMSSAYPYIDFGNKTVAVLPPHHTYGSTIMLIGHLMIGCEVYISAGLKYVTLEFKQQQPEHMVLVPLYLETVYRKIRSTLNDKGIYKKVLLQFPPKISVLPLAFTVMMKISSPQRVCLMLLQKILA